MEVRWQMSPALCFYITFNVLFLSAKGSFGVWLYVFLRSSASRRSFVSVASITERTRTGVLILTFPKYNSFHVAWSPHSKAGVEWKIKLFLLILLLISPQ